MQKTIIANKKSRKSNQRKVILEELKKVITHPTAKQIYKIVQKRIPDIGLATVYRNLDYLEKKKQIIKLKSKEKEARYDGRIEKHCHLICRGCNGILDLIDVEKILIKSKELKKSGFKIDPSYAEMFGDCENCQ